MDDIDTLRAEIDRLDRGLVEGLRQRMRVVAQVARIKADGLPFLRDHERESRLLAQVEEWARETDLDPFRVREIFREVDLDPRIAAKTSLVFTTPHRHGALAHCLNVLADHGLNLTKLESRPVIERPWEYRFYVDFEGDARGEAAALAVAELRRECPELRVLGSYPARTTVDGSVDRVGGAGPPTAKK